MPSWAQSDPNKYWNAADQYERVNGRLFKEVEFALPRELARSAQIDLACKFAEILTSSEHLPYSLSIHAGKGHNPHCHLVISERINDGVHRPPEVWFSRAATQGKSIDKYGAKKTRSLKPKSWLLNARQSWAELANHHLGLNGESSRIDHRTLKDQGISECKQPPIHLGAKAAALERKGVRTDRGNHIRKTRKSFQQLYDELHFIDQEIINMKTTIESATEGKNQAKEIHDQDCKPVTARSKVSQLPRFEGTTGDPKFDKYYKTQWKVSYKAKLWRELYGTDLPEHFSVEYIDLKGRDGARIRLGGRSLIVDQVDQITARNGDQAEIDAMLQIARSKGWENLKISGTVEFRRQAALSALGDGFEVDEDTLKLLSESEIEGASHKVTLSTFSGSSTPDVDTDKEWEEILDALKAHCKDPNALKQQLQSTHLLDPTADDAGLKKHRGAGPRP